MNDAEKGAGVVVGLTIDPTAGRVAAVVVVVVPVNVIAGWVGNEERPAAKPIMAWARTPIAAVASVAGEARPGVLVGRPET
jgi:hypothetical protein